MDSKNLVVGLGLGALGAAALAYYGFVHTSDMETNRLDVPPAEMEEQEKSKRPDPDQTAPGEGLLDGVNRVIGKTFFKVGTSRATSEGTDNNNSNTNIDDGSNNNNNNNNNNKVDTAAVKDEVTGALGNWGNFWKEQYKVQRVHQGGPKN